MEDKLQQAIALIKLGDKKNGRRILAEILQADPKNETAWLWLSGIVTRDEERRYCLNQVLAANPDNTKAKTGLGWLDQKSGQAQSVKTQEQTTTSSTDQPKTENPPAIGAQSSTETSGKIKTPFIKKYLGWIIGGIIFCVIACAALCFVFISVMRSHLPTRIDTEQIIEINPGVPTATPSGEDITDPNYLAGKSAYEAKEYDQVLKLMSRVIEAHPDLAPPHWYRGMAYFYLNDYHTALDEMEAALALDPDYALGYADRGLMYNALGDEKRAVADWQKALELDPTLAKVYHNIGVMYYNRGDYSNALEAYTTAVEIDPKRAVTWDDLSGTQLALNQYQDCIDSASRAIALQPDLWESYYNRGTCQSNLDQYAAAAGDFDIYLDNVTGDPKGWYNRGLTNRRLGNIQEAVDDYTRAIDLDPDFTWAFINRGIAYEGLKEYESALNDYNAALDLGDIPRAYVGRGDVYQALGRYEDAITEYQHALRLMPSYGEVYAHLVGAYVGQEEYQKAIDTAEDALRYDSGENQLIILQSRGRAYYGLGDYERALNDLNEVMQSNPTVMDHYYRGIVYQANGQTQEAIQDLEAFILYGGAQNQTLIDDVNARLVELQSKDN